MSLMMYIHIRMIILSVAVRLSRLVVNHSFVFLPHLIVAAPLAIQYCKPGFETAK